MKTDKAYCRLCNSTTPENNFGHANDEHFGRKPEMSNLLSMWYSDEHAGPQRAGYFWAWRLSDD
ncbi:hypothetical protein HVTV-2_gp168 [Haloarcula virus HVTV-2]|uniref:Uncharacterized protein n=1 Tax=Haloarcula vallismortis tailed virus 1 TaxID=1262528 RepID=L7TKM4_9CAUD|nr:hypothetical protein HVTV1_166 [Haloarcula vallismortis tailed virus 1]AGC34535.1 hypothetical protein HVTV1_166 [Haloarcula vallismortis tailed virus 1]UBF22975.1 hypothetical protein HVTV-2_gp168 [Haloarcula virus HVTV-2]